MSDSLQLHRLQHTRLPCPSLSSWVCSNSCPLSQQCQLTISSSVALLSFCLQAFPASGSFPVSWLFASGAHSTESSASASVLPMKILGWFPLELTDLIFLQFKGLSRIFFSTTTQKYQFFSVQPSLWSNMYRHLYTTTGKTIALTIQIFVGKVMTLLFNMLFRFSIAFLPRSKCLLISWLQSPSAVILGPKKIKSATVSTVSPSICHELMVPDAIILVFFMLSCKPAFSLSSRTLLKKFLLPLLFLPLEWHYHPHIWGSWYFPRQSWFQPVLPPAQHCSWCTLHVTQISRVSIYSLVLLLSQFWTSQLFHFWL